MPRTSRKSKSKDKSSASTRRRIMGASAGMSVDALQTVFSKIEDRMRTMISNGSSDKQIGHCLSKVWSDNFHRDLSAPAVRGMVVHYRAICGLPVGPQSDSKKRRKTRRRQRGGMAPLDYTMGQGISAPVYGRFPVDYSVTPSVLNSMNRYFESPVGRSCNSVAGHDAPGQSGGSFGAAVGLAAPVLSAPPNSVQLAQNNIVGSPYEFSSSSPVTQQAHNTQIKLDPYDPAGLSQLSGLRAVYQAY